MAKITAELSVRWAIHHENDSGKWNVVAVVLMNGRPLTSIIAASFITQDDAQRLLDYIMDT